MPTAAIIYHALNGWVNTSSVTSTGGMVAIRRLIASRSDVIRMTDARM